MFIPSYLPRLEQLRNDLKKLIEKESHLQEQIDTIGMDIEDVKEEIKQELEANYFI